MDNNMERERKKFTLGWNPFWWLIYLIVGGFFLLFYLAVAVRLRSFSKAGALTMLEFGSFDGMGSGA